MSAGYRGAVRGALVVTAVSAAACADRRADGPAPGVRDSAGVRIVEYAAWKPPALAWAVAAEPSVVIGSFEGEEAYQFDRIQGVTRLADGRIVVADGGTQELRYFDAAGRHRRTAGRKGAGPGEFEGLGPIARLSGDTVVAHDWNLRRLSYFDPSGTFVRAVTIRYDAGAAFPIGRFAGGGWLAQPGFTFAPGNEGTEVVRDTSAFLIFDDEGVLRDSVGRYIGPDFYVRSEGQFAFASSLPFGRGTEAAVAGDRFWAGYTERYELIRRTPAGAADLVIRAARAPVAVTEADVTAHKRERLATADDQFRQRLERLYRDIPFPSSMPAFEDVQVDPDGRLWVLEVVRPGDERRRWTVYDPTGRMLGAIDTPRRVAIREIGRDYLLGTWSDDLDVQYVRLYRLDRGSDRP